MFDFHKLIAYQKTKETNKEIFELISSVEFIHKSLADQLVRASSSMLLNIAEGSGRSTDRDKRHFYVIAKGSAYECVALLDIFQDLNYIGRTKYQSLCLQLEEIVKILFGLIKSLEK